MHPWPVFWVWMHLEPGHAAVLFWLKTFLCSVLDGKIGMGDMCAAAIDSFSTCKYLTLHISAFLSQTQLLTLHISDHFGQTQLVTLQIFTPFWQTELPFRGWGLILLCFFFCFKLWWLLVGRGRTQPIYVYIYIYIYIYIYTHIYSLSLFLVAGLVAWWRNLHFTNYQGKTVWKARCSYLQSGKLTWAIEKNTGLLGFIGGYTTQLYRDYNKPL